MQNQILTLLLLFAALTSFSNALYIKSKADNNLSTPASKMHSNDWADIQQKLGLTNEKVQILKAQKDRKTTLDLLKRFIKENPRSELKPDETKELNPFVELYRSLVHQLQLSKSTLKTTLNFELADKPTTKTKNLKRSRRKIAIKMVSDMHSDQIDDLLKVFNIQHGINPSDDGDSSYEETDYSDITLPLPVPSAIPDFMYENLYEDEEDLAVPAKSHHNSEYGSIQNLIMEANRNQWQREIEETRLKTQNKKRFL